jgi:hypothetical protein
VRFLLVGIWKIKIFWCLLAQLLSNCFTAPIQVVLLLRPQVLFWIVDSHETVYMQLRRHHIVHFITDLHALNTKATLILIKMSSMSSDSHRLYITEGLIHGSLWICSPAVSNSVMAAQLAKHIIVVISRSSKFSHRRTCPTCRFGKWIWNGRGNCVC